MHWEQSEFISDKHCVMEHLRKLSYPLRSKESTHDQILNPDKHKTWIFQDVELSFASIQVVNNIYFERNKSFFHLISYLSI